MINYRGIQNPGAGGGGPGPSTDRRAPKIIVGNALNGDLIADVDFLDTGNGAQVAAACAAAAGFPFGADIWVRPGLYDLGAGGAPAAPLYVPPNVTLRGVGPSSVFRSRTAALSDYRVFRLATDTLLENVTISIPPPIPGVPIPAVPGAAIDCEGAFHLARGITYHFDKMTLAEYEMYYTTVQSFIKTGAALRQATIFDITPLSAAGSAAPSAVLLGAASQFAFAGFPASGAAQATCFVQSMFGYGGDIGVSTNVFTKAAHCALVPAEVGVYFGPGANASILCDSEIYCTAGGTAPLGGTCRGVVATSVESVRIVDNLISAKVILDPLVGSLGVWITNAAADCVVNGNVIDRWDTGTLIDPLCPTNIVTSNRYPVFGAATVIDGGGTSVVANNL